MILLALNCNKCHFHKKEELETCRNPKVVRLDNFFTLSPIHDATFAILTGKPMDNYPDYKEIKEQ